ncbi:hypothetical protein NHX12_008152 [Muraenolepis orangiensis]|uniref:CASP C-terminal domain-containing protein n=1 Tax=Muraenolepis orangiensis TaxID=630683 RepID=A0A9Q0DKT3_9TELE|nr:hypothetical protein NHX12_008152 [Muraenolepis orangiensis]
MTTFPFSVPPPPHAHTHTHRAGRYTELQLEFGSAVRTSAEQKDLILKLEHDLSTIQSMGSLVRPDADGSDLTNMDGIPGPIKEASAMFTGSGVPTHTELPQGQMDSLLSIISSQRERFRSRNQELETESRSMQQTMQALQGELDSLRADNIKLYEKIKFLQSYPGRGRGILSNKMARTIAFFYTLFLHCLVFLVGLVCRWRDWD